MEKYKYQKDNLQFHMETQKSRVIKTILNKKGTAIGLTTTDNKLYFKALVMKAAFHWHKQIH